MINNFLIEKDSFIFESVEKGFIKGRYTIFGRNPDKIWEFNNNNCKLFYKNKSVKLKGNPKKNTNTGRIQILFKCIKSVYL